MGGKKQKACLAAARASLGYGKTYPAWLYTVAIQIFAIDMEKGETHPPTEEAKRKEEWETQGAHSSENWTTGETAITAPSGKKAAKGEKEKKSKWRRKKQRN